MAWVARIDTLADDGKGSINVHISYFDSADTSFVTLLGQSDFTFPAAMPLSDMATQVVGKGQSIRAAQAISAQLQNRVGTTINVP